jgi:hypothetical protein
MPHLTFIQIYKIYGYGRYKMHGNVININVLVDVDRTQFILSRLL